MGFSDPAKNVTYFGLKPGMVVADFGSGSGAYALEMAKVAGSDLKVYALDVQKDLLSRLAKMAKEAKLNNLEVLWGDVEKLGGSKLKDGSLDLVLVSNLLFQTNGKYTMALEIKRVLKPGGRVVLIDWSDSFGGLGPTPTQVITAPAALAIFNQAGFEELKSFPAGEHHWGVILQKPLIK